MLQSIRALLLGCLLVATALSAGAQTSFVEFESGPVRPLAMSPDGTRLFAVNTPDNRLEVFSISAGSLTHLDSIPVGMEPVAVAARSNTEVWVVNHLSDSVSIVDLSSTPARVSRTLLVGDEPRDIVFAGTNRAFISTAHRGQYRTYTACSGGATPGAACLTSATCGGGTCVNPIASAFVLPSVPDPQLTTEGIGRADVWVFDATSLGNALGGTPVRVLSFFADTPRALATDGTTVYVAAFHSGNQTTTVNETVVCDGFQVSGGTDCGAGAPGGVALPATNCLQTDGDPACEQSVAAPETSIIVKWNGSSFRDTLNRNWTSLVPFTLPDRDVFGFNADTLAATTTFTSVGTILFNMVVNPISGRVYVTNTELPNHVRFEGPGIHGGSTVQGHLSESSISVLNPSGSTVDRQTLNHHIEYGDLHTDASADHGAIDAQKTHSLATPVQAVVSSDGSTLYVAAFGSGKIGVFSTAALENPLFDGNRHIPGTPDPIPPVTPSYDPTAGSANYITTGGGPAGLVLDQTNNRLYVLTRFDNKVRVINPSTKGTVQIRSLHNPEPAAVVTGRPFLYDAQVSSGNGETSCSSCHIFGDFDSLAWDLGNPDDATSSNTQPSATALLPPATTFHPMKGPMTTQTLRGMATHGGMHWRGDRVSGFFGTDPCNNALPDGPCDEDFSFRNFIVAFEGLLGKHGTITPAQMQQFTDFILQVFLPPNPIRNLDNSTNAAQTAGSNLYFGCGPGTTECPAPNAPGTTDVVEDCDGCHNLNPARGMFGSGGEQSFEGEPQNAKVPHTRNMYQKIGMFFDDAGDPNGRDQVRGFGFLHDGSVDTLNTFHSAGVFNLNETQEQQLEAFNLAFPSDIAPVVGQQITLTSTNGGVANSRIDLLVTRAGTAFTSLMLGGGVTECDLIVKGSVGGVKRGWRRTSGTTPANTNYLSDVNTAITDAALRALAGTEGPLTYTCAPPGSGTRMGIDRDLDADLDGLDNCPSVPNPGQEDGNSNGIGDACELGADSDGDGIVDGSDNCQLVINPLQENFDGDAQGDACDADDDNDGLLDTVETNTGTYVSPTNTGSNPLDADTDGDDIDDGDEVANGWNPNNPNDPPASIPLMPFWATLLLIGVVLFVASRLLRRRGGGPASA